MFFILKINDNIFIKMCFIYNRSPFTPGKKKKFKMLRVNILAGASAITFKKLR